MDQRQVGWSDEGRRYGVAHLRLRQVAELVRETGASKIVDIGCAQGRLRNLCPRMSYVGCDFVRPVEAAEFEFVQCDLNAQPLPAEFADLELIVCSGFLEYVDDLPALLLRLRERLLPGGQLIATYFNMNHLSRIVALLQNRTFPVHPAWRGFYSPREMEGLLVDAGYSIERVVVSHHSLKPSPRIEETERSRLKMPREWPWSYLFGHQFIFLCRRRA